MRQIKFRGKPLIEYQDNHPNDMQYAGMCMWAYGTFVPAEDGDTACIVQAAITKKLSPFGPYVEFSPTYWVNIVPETVGQYIGLKDKNNNELYEGDIVQVFDTEFKVSFKGVIKFGDASFYIDGLDGTTHYRWQDYEVEKIGNIYDNPELLEVGE